MNQLEFKDGVMQSLVKRVHDSFGVLDPITPLTPENYFSDLAEAILGQQLSTKAAATIVGRIKAYFPDSIIIPRLVLSANTEDLRALGASYAKISYIKNLAGAFIENQTSYQELHLLSDEEIIQELTKIKGIGRWTVEMFLIFGLGRPDVFSPGDLGLKNAMLPIYNLDKSVKPSTLVELAENWAPNRSYASRILWKSLELKN